MKGETGKKNGREEAALAGYSCSSRSRWRAFGVWRMEIFEPEPMSPEVWKPAAGRRQVSLRTEEVS